MASPPIAAAPGRAPLARRARRLLSAHDAAGYRRLLDGAGQLADRNDRYRAGVQLLQLGLARAVSDAAGDGLPAALAQGAVAMLEREPREPVVLGLAARAFRLLSLPHTAAALHEAAVRLDPALAGADPARCEIAARRGRGRERGEPPARTALGRLALRARELADRARPAEGLRLSLCMIVRDEQEMLPRCLAAVAHAVDELVVVDTGSTDRTIEIARSFGARVIERAWTGSFAEARNVSLDAASGDWLMYLDADEVLVAEDARRLRALTGRTWREAFYLAETSYTGDADDGTAFSHSALRVLRNRPEYRFHGRLHEQIADRLPAELPERLERTGIRVEHFGYLGAVRHARAKSARNVALLRAQLKEGPATPFVHYNLGSELAAAGEHAAALIELERAWALLEGLPDRDEHAFAPALATRLVAALRACARPAEAAAWAARALERFPGLTDLVYEQALAAVALGREREAIELCRRCLAMGDAPARYTARVGAGGALARVQLAALLRARGDLAAAIEQLERCLRERPGFLGAVLPYAAALLASGLPADTVADRLEALVPDPAPAVRFTLGTALYESGAVLAAERQFRAALRRRPSSGRARVALGETLLAQRRYGDAAAVAAEMAACDPLAAVACRTELFARIASGDLAGADAALARAERLAMAPGERQLFAAWRELAAGGGLARALGDEAVEPLAVALEALLRVHDFDTFEMLVALLERTPLPVRERRQLLAEMYLRRGFAASAAREWMAICHERPDARALVGLARVAAQRGMREDASTFAAAALAEDPDNADAAALLAA